MAEFLFERRIARQCLLEYKGAKAPLDRVLNDTLREHRVGAGQRPLISDLVYKVIRFWPTLLGDLKFNPELVDHQRRLDTVFDFVLKKNRADLSVYHEKQKPTFDQNPALHLSRYHGVPGFLLEEIRAGGLEKATHWHEFFHQCFDEGPVTIRWNEKKLSIDEVKNSFPENLVEESPFLPGSAYLARRVNLKENVLFQKGLIDLQDESSQLVSRLAAPAPGIRVLDLCAGAGGKTLHMAELMEGRGEICAYDISSNKLGELSRRARKLGLTNVRVLTQLPSRKEKFDVVLVDAPCSGVGVLRRNPERLQYLKHEDILKLEKIQKELIAIGLGHLVPQGTLVYATCTLRERENFAKISQFVQQGERSWIPIKNRLQNILGAGRADRLLTVLAESPAHRLALGKNEGALQWGPSFGRQASGGWKGDGFFVSLVK